ncbi:MAG: transporter [Candidatus Eremiobacteraeota bacterium]|nr:transporter [Candidatus Eremiobacteraeota bacterium]
MVRTAIVAVAALICGLASLPSRALAGAALSPSSPVPSPSPSPTAPSDPCGSILSIVNRPTVSTGVCTVRPGHFDVETGYTNTTTSGVGGGSSAVYPQALVRVGTADPHFDVEFGLPSHETSSVGTPAVTGWGDVSLAAKYELGYSSAADWGLYAAITYPTGSKAFTAGNAEFTGDLDGGYTISPEFSLAGTLSFNALSGPNATGLAQSYFAFIPSVELSAALPGGPSQISAEYAYYSAAGPNLGSKSLIDFVYQRVFGSHLEFDTEYGFSPTLVNGQKQHYIGAGLSFMN